MSERDCDTAIINSRFIAQLVLSTGFCHQFAFLSFNCIIWYHRLHFSVLYGHVLVLIERSLTHLDYFLSVSHMPFRLLMSRKTTTVL